MFESKIIQRDPTEIVPDLSVEQAAVIGRQVRRGLRGLIPQDTMTNIRHEYGVTFPNATIYWQQLIDIATSEERIGTIQEETGTTEWDKVVRDIPAADVVHGEEEQEVWAGQVDTDYYRNTPALLERAKKIMQQYRAYEGPYQVNDTSFDATERADEDLKAALRDFLKRNHEKVLITSPSSDPTPSEHVFQKAEIIPVKTYREVPGGIVWQRREFPIGTDYEDPLIFTFLRGNSTSKTDEEISRDNFLIRTTGKVLFAEFEPYLLEPGIDCVNIDGYNSEITSEDTFFNGQRGMDPEDLSYAAEYLQQLAGETPSVQRIPILFLQENNTTDDAYDKTRDLIHTGFDLFKAFIVVDLSNHATRIRRFSENSYTPFHYVIMGNRSIHRGIVSVSNYIFDRFPHVVQNTRR